MDWPHYPPVLQAAEDDTDTDLSHFGDINFPFDPSHFALPQSHPSDLFLDPPPSSRLPAVEPLPSPHLPTFDPPSWPTTSPPSPTASTTSASSASSFSHSSETSSHSDNSTRSPTPHPPTIPTPPTSRTPTIPATLAVSPHLLQRLHPPPLSPPTNTSTTPSHSPLTTRRKRTAGLTAQQRAELKRQKHREIDANRIQREKAAVKKLTVLTTTSNSLQQLSSGGRDERIVEEEEEVVEGVEEVEGRRDKVTVLEDSARKIDELQRLVSRLTDACDAQQANNRTLVLQLQLAIRQPPPLLSTPRSSSSALFSAAAPSDSSHPLSLLPSLVSQRLDAHIGSASLHSSWFVSSSVAIAVIRVSTGCVLDVNDRLLHESGWQRPHIVGRLMCPPYDLIIAPESYTEQSFLDLSPQRILIDGPDGRLVPARTQRQYERSKVLIQELYRGDKQHIFCVFRYQMKDGRVYEVKSTVWTTSWLEERGKDGVVRRKPESIFMVCSYPDAVIVDEAPM